MRSVIGTGMVTMNNKRLPFKRKIFTTLVVFIMVSSIFILNHSSHRNTNNDMKDGQNFDLCFLSSDSSSRSSEFRGGESWKQSSATDFVSGSLDDTVVKGSGEDAYVELLRQGWTRITPTTTPLPRVDHDMVYIARENKAMMFGGISGFSEKYHNSEYVLNDTWFYDFNSRTWIEKKPSVSPSGRFRHAMVYDSISNVIILFGGRNNIGDENFYDTWVYDLKKNTWMEMHPVTSPSKRHSHAMVFDEQRGVAVLYGGYGNKRYSDTWTYNYMNNTWTNMNPKDSPGGTYRHAMAYDSVNHIIVLYGGLSNPNTWVYSLSSNLWVQRFPIGNIPENRRYSEMIFHKQLGKVILFGGEYYTTYLDDLWSYDVILDHWELIDQGPDYLGRFGHAMIYNSQSEDIILFGGNSNHSGMQSDLLSYSFNQNGWEFVHRSSTPSPRYRHNMVYDSVNEAILLFGGLAGVSSEGTRDTWLYYFNNNTWRRIFTPTSPYESWGISDFIYNSKRGRAILLQHDNDQVGHIWEFDSKNLSWQKIIESHDPYSGEMVYDSANDVVILFQRGTKNSTWMYNITSHTWTELHPTTAPDPRRDYDMVYDKKAGKTVLFGGALSSGTVNDTWEYDFSTNNWTKKNPPISPLKMEDYSMVYNSNLEKIMLFGGWKYSYQEYSEDSNETWFYDTTLDTWTLRNASSKPPGMDMHKICYDEINNVTILFAGWPDHPYDDEYPNRQSIDTFAFDTFSQHGELISTPHNTTLSSATFNQIFWNSTSPQDTRIKFQIRTGSNESYLFNSTWYGPTNEDDYYMVSGSSINSIHNGPDGMWVQYKMILETSNITETSIVDDFTITYY